jgi:predicted methyltransferase MtxX (methanogen marker protein 4)
MAEMFRERLRELARLRRRRIAVGLKTNGPRITASLEAAREYVDIVLVGPEEIVGFDCRKAENPVALIELAHAGEVDGVFRGNFDAVETYGALRRVLGTTGRFVSINPLLVRKVQCLDEPEDRLVCMLPVSPTRGATLAGRIEEVDACVRFLRAFGIEPRIGILSAGKPSDVLAEDPVVDRTLAEAAFLVEWFSSRGLPARHFNHQAEYAFVACNVIVYPDGISGNQALRAAMFLGENVLLGSMLVGLPFGYSQTAESMLDWTLPLLFMSAHLNNGGNQ